MQQNNNLKNNLSYLWQRRNLIITWTRYNLYADYIDTKLGLIWIFLEPVITAAVYSLAFGTLLGARPPRDGVPFICFYLSGIILWQFFNSSVAQSANIIFSNINMMTQIRFPREAAILVKFCENLVDLLASLIVMEIVLLISGYSPNIYYLYIPLIFLPLFLLTLGLMFFIGSIGVFVRDLPQLVNPILRLLFFISGVLFSIDNINSWLKKVLFLNPILVLIESFRKIVLHFEKPDLSHLVIWTFISFLVMVFGYIYFKKKDATFVDHL